MKRYISFLSSVLPYFAAELIHYSVAYNLSMVTGEAEADMIYIFSIIAAFTCGVVFYFWYRVEIRGEVRGNLKDILTIKNIGLFTLLGIGCQFFFAGLMNLLVPYFTEMFNQYSSIVHSITSGNIALVLLLMLVVAPISEELIFRGVILHMANRHITFLGANLLQAILFGFFHGNIIQGIYAALLGFLLGIICNKYKSLIAPIVLHVIINASSFLTYLVPDSILSSLIIMITGGIFIILILLLLKPTERIPLRINTGDISKHE